MANINNKIQKATRTICLLAVLFLISIIIIIIYIFIAIKQKIIRYDYLKQ